MRFMATTDTDIGNRREVNQDSMLIRHVAMPAGEVLLCVICDGMGGLSRGELASATVVRAFSDWFDREMTGGKSATDPHRTGKQWGILLEDLNRTLLSYGEKEKIHLGTTFSGILFVGDLCLICHVGDSRIYHLGEKVRQLTEDQTLVARDVKAGLLTREQAKNDERRNILLQCVGASPSLCPQIIVKNAEPGVYLLCSDVFCHETTTKEMYKNLCPEKIKDSRAMHRGAKQLIELAKTRGETDNISAIVVRAFGGQL